MQGVSLWEMRLGSGTVDVVGLPGGQQLRAGGAEAGVVELEHVEG